MCQSKRMLPDSATDEKKLSISRLLRGCSGIRQVDMDWWNPMCTRHRSSPVPWEADMSKTPICKRLWDLMRVLDSTAVPWNPPLADGSEYLQPVWPFAHLA